MTYTKLLALACLSVLLSACHTDPPAPPSPDFVDKEELKKAIDLKPLPEFSSQPAYLGLAGILTGPTDQKHAAHQPLDLRAVQAIQFPAFLQASAGKIIEAGKVNLELPKEPLAKGNEALNYKKFAEAYASGDVCAVNTIEIAAGQEQAIITHFYASTPRQAGSAISPMMSPPVAFADALPFYKTLSPEVSETLGILVFASEDLDLKAEFRCTYSAILKIEDMTQYNTRIQVNLKKGWNVLYKRAEEKISASRMKSIHRVITGGAQHYALAAKP